MPQKQRRFLSFSLSQYQRPHDLQPKPLSELNLPEVPEITEQLMTSK